MELIELSKAEIVETPAEGATLFCMNPDGTVNRVSAANVGGNARGGIKTAIIKDSLYDQMLAGEQINSSAASEVTYSCINMSFEEAYEMLASGEPMKVHFMLGGEGAMNMDVIVSFFGTMINGVPCIGLAFTYPKKILLYWTAGGISKERPVGGEV